MNLVARQRLEVVNKTRSNILRLARAVHAAVCFAIIKPVKDEIRALADRAAELKRHIDERVADMEQDDRSHVLTYEVLGISRDVGKLIDVYQNRERFLYECRRTFAVAIQHNNK